MFRCERRARRKYVVTVGGKVAKIRRILVSRSRRWQAFRVLLAVDYCLIRRELLFSGLPRAGLERREKQRDVYVVFIL